MKLVILPIYITSIFFFGCTSGLPKQDAIVEIQEDKKMDSFQFTFASSHPNAKALMADEFFYSPIEETGPFGSDDGSDAAYGFREWRQLNRTASPVTYLGNLIKSWHYPYFDYNELDSTKIMEYIDQETKISEADIQQQINVLKEMDKFYGDTSSKKLDDKQLREVVLTSSRGMNGLYLLGQDNAIIGIGFAQFVLEGRIDEDIKGLTTTAIKRQLLPLLISRYEEKHRDKRKRQLTKMLEVIDKAVS